MSNITERIEGCRGSSSSRAPRLPLLVSEFRPAMLRSSTLLPLQIVSEGRSAPEPAAQAAVVGKLRKAQAG